MKTNKILALLLVCAIILMGKHTVYAEENISALNYKDEILKNGICVANEDGSYSFTLISESTARSNAVQGVQMSYMIIPTTEEAKESLQNAVETARASGGTITLEESDAAMYVHAYCTIKWTSYTTNNRTYIYLTDVSGGYSAEGNGSYIASGVSVVGQSVTFGQSGFSEDGKTITQNTTKDVGTSARSFSYSIPSSWKPIAKDGKYAIMGANYIITLQRGNSSWTCEIYNNYG